MLHIPVERAGDEEHDLDLDDPRYAPSSSVPMTYSVIGTGTADITYTA